MFRTRGRVDTQPQRVEVSALKLQVVSTLAVIKESAQPQRSEQQREKHETFGIGKEISWQCRRRHVVMKQRTISNPTFRRCISSRDNSRELSVRSDTSAIELAVSPPTVMRSFARTVRMEAWSNCPGASVLRRRRNLIAMGGSIILVFFAGCSHTACMASGHALICRTRFLFCLKG